VIIWINEAKDSPKRQKTKEINEVFNNIGSADENK
jgi:hypothetical protein